MGRGGFWDRILHVDLSEGEVWVESPGEGFFRTYVGGGCLGAYYLLRKAPRGSDPLSGENVLVLAPSVVTGGPVPGTGRHSAVAKSPLTGGVAASEAGGYWGVELKRAGFDAVVITGRAKYPVYLWITDGRCEIRDARPLWGKDTGEVQRLIREELGDDRVQVLLIGPAGERGVRFANLASGTKNFHGRGGLGAVMGAKLLKAVAVRGHQEVPFADRTALVELARDFAQHFKENIDIRTFVDYGTAGYVLPQNEVGGLPTRNFQSGHFEGAEKISGERLKERYLIDQEGCYACPIRCKRVVASERPYHVDPLYGGPEYETLAALGSYLGIDQLGFVIKMNELCNRYGVDTISLGGTLAWAMECVERGILSRDEVGLDLVFGNAEAAMAMLERIVAREGFGDVLAEGAWRAAQRFGKEAMALVVHAKGQEFPAHEPRLKRSLALAYATVPKGADHCSSEHDVAIAPNASEAVFGAIAPLGILERLPLTSLDPRKVRFYYLTQQMFSLYDTLVLCLFVTPPIRYFSFEQLVALVQAASGWNTGLLELFQIGERKTNLCRAFNVREGLGAEADTLPPRMYSPLKGGPTDGYRVDPEEFRRARALYYQMAGWTETGVPTPGKLHGLGLGWVVKQLRAAGML